LDEHEVHQEADIIDLTGITIVFINLLAWTACFKLPS